MIRLEKGDALIIADVQKDFLPGGALGVKGGDEIIRPLNRAARLFADHQLPVYASRDWHPAGHCSFREQGGPWPVHCLADSPGARFSEELKLPDGTEIVNKATRKEEEAYSAFHGTDLEDRLRRAEVKRIFVGGLTTDYCVLNTVRDAVKEKLEVVVLEDSIRPVNVSPGDEKAAKAEMRRLGAVFSSTEELR